MLQNDFKNRTKLMEATSSPDFLKVIPNAVDEYCAKKGIRPSEKRSKHRAEEEYASYAAPKVEIDVSKLAEIRNRSEELARKLIIDEQPETAETSGTRDEFEAFEAAAGQIGDDEFSARIDECREELSPHEDEELPLKSSDPAFDELDGDWKTFANNLIPTQIKVLKAMLNGNGRAFCKENGLLPETVFEQINTEALSAFGDVVVECGELVSDYADNVALIVKASGI